MIMILILAAGWVLVVSGLGIWIVAAFAAMFD